MPDRVTMADVAREAGVSLMTVSRVINHKDDVSATTRQHVLEVIEQLGYRPSGIARGLATQRTGTLGLVVPTGVGTSARCDSRFVKIDHPHLITNRCVMSAIRYSFAIFRSAFHMSLIAFPAWV